MSAAPPEIRDLLSLPYFEKFNSFGDLKERALEILELRDSKEKLKVSIKKKDDNYELYIGISDYQGYFRMRNCSSEYTVESTVEVLRKTIKNLKSENIRKNKCFKVI